MPVTSSGTNGCDERRGCQLDLFSRLIKFDREPRQFYPRSEERRVGKECRICWSAAQAEDGIRDIGVTGVQTCALPISVKAGPSTVIAIAKAANGFFIRPFLHARNEQRNKRLR